MRQRRVGSEPAAHGVPGFNEWLRTQLKVKRMSQRQLAQQSGVDHSTISRLIVGARTPSLETAIKLARGLREFGSEVDAGQYFDVSAATASHPAARVEYALRADDLLSPLQIRGVMKYYLAVRGDPLSEAVRPVLRSIAPLPEAHIERRLDDVRQNDG